jgi:hypothetical protein
MGDPTIKTISYRKGGVPIKTGKPVKVELPPTTFRARLKGLLYDTNKSFLLPSAIHGMRALKRLFDEHKNLALLVNGHTDRAGTDDYNLRLSDERAKSMSAYLRDAVDEWMKFYGTGVPDEKRWGAHEDGLMLGQVVPADKLSDPGDPTPATSGNVRAFQQLSNDTRGTGLPVGGKMSDPTRRALVAAYMAQPGTSLPDGVVPLTHGCGPFHNEVPTAPGVAEQKNRRTEIFFFEDRVTPEPRHPCPGPKGCPEYPEWVKRATKTIDLDSGAGSLTVQVRDPSGAAVEGAAVHLDGPLTEDGTSDAAGGAPFPDMPAGGYTVSVSREGFSDGETAAVVGDGSQGTAKMTLDPISSLDNPRVIPAAADGEVFSFRLLDLRRTPCANCEATVTAGSTRVFGKSDASGLLAVRLPKGTDRVTVTYAPRDAQSLVTWPVRLGLPSVDDPEGAKGRLLNLGYPADADLGFSLSSFQAEHGLDTTVQLDAATKAKLVEAHGG